jgi:cytochrome b561
MTPGLLREGFSRAWHYQRVLWFMFAISLVLGHFSAGAITHKLDGVTDHSLQSLRLTTMFDYGTYSALESNPEVKLFEVAGVSISFSLLFFVIVLFLTGGILEAYRSGRTLTTREFFEASGSYFWRWVRLLVMMVVVMIPFLMLLKVVTDKPTTMMLSAAQEKTGFCLLFGGLGLIILILMCIRLWFDMAQVRAVVEEETRMWRNAGRAFKLTYKNFGSLFWMYFRISLVGWLVMALGLYIWAKMPPARSQLTFLILELVVLLGFGTRLWQRACEMVWYQRRFLAPLTLPVPVPAAPAPSPLLTIAPPPQ